ncbi:MAG: DUF4347 domain-containing protein, partial [Geitlerinemataceae cyanobacterium]
MLLDRASTDRTVLVFDARVDAAELRTGPNATACAQLTVDRDRDGIERIAQFLAQRHAPIASLHLVAHGSVDRLALGKTPLDLTTLPRYAPAIARWREWLTDDAEIILYGCNIAASSEALPRAIHQLTGARVAASSTPVGASDRGGNWDLDVRIGDRDWAECGAERDPVLFAGETRRRYRGVMLDPTVFTDAPDGFVTTDAEVTLREAIDETEDGGTIQLEAGTYLIEDAVSADRGDDDNKRGDFDIVDKSLTIRGAGADQTFIDAQTLDRVFHVLDGASLTLEGVTVTNGLLTDFADKGGGIFNEGDLRLTDATVTGNTAREGIGGGVMTQSGSLEVVDSTISGNTTEGGGAGGGIGSFDSTVTIKESTISNNTSYGSGGGITAERTAPGSSSLTIENSTISGNRLTSLSFAKGGGVYSFGMPMTIVDSTISDNTARSGAGVSVYSGASLVLEKSQVSANTASGDGGGIEALQSSGVTIRSSNISGNTSVFAGAGLSIQESPATIESSSISGNQTPSRAGGLRVYSSTVTIANSTVSSNISGIEGGGILNAGTLSLNHVTIANNSAPASGGLLNAAVGGGDVRGTIADLSNSILADNANGDFTNGVGNADPILTGVNLVADSSLTGFNILNVDPLLGPLKQNGGGTLTHALSEESPALEVGDRTRAQTFDQRALERNRDPDLGAFELIDLVTILESAGSTKVLEGFSGNADTSSSDPDINDIGDFYFVGLNFQPDSDVTIDLAFDDSRIALTETTLTFTPDNWDVPQFVFVAAIDDTVNTGGRAATIDHSANSEDLRFFIEDIKDVDVAIFDDDGTAGATETLTPPLAYGDDANAIYTGTNEVESIIGNGGLDMIFGRGGSDRLYGGAGG